MWRRRLALATLGVSALVCSIFGPGTVAAERLWVPTSPAAPQVRVTGEIQSWPAQGGLHLSGWVVDAFSATRADLVQVFDDADRLLGEVKIGGFVRRPDVAERFGSSAYSLSGFELSVQDRPQHLVVRAHLGQLGWWQTSVDTPWGHIARIMQLSCPTPDDVEVAVTSSDPFPVRDALVELAIGPVVSSLSRYGDDGDLHTLIFMLTQDQVASVAPADTAVVRYNPGSADATWLIGAIDPQALANPCDASLEE